MLDGAERLELVQSQLRPKAEFAFSWDKLSQSSGLRTKDLIAPSVLDFKPDGRADCYRADGAWCRVLVFRGFGSDLEDDCIANVVDLPMPLNVTLHIHPMGKAAAVAYVKKRIAWMDKEVIDEQMSAVKKGYDFSILPPELSHSKEEAEELLDQLQNKNQRLFTYTGLVFTYADTAEALDHQTRQIMAAARQRSIEVEPLSYRQRQGMNSILPLGLNHVEVSRYMTTAQIAIQMPFASQELNQEGGGYYGQNRHSLNLVIANRKKLASPMGFVGGKPGSGKSFQTKREITNTRLAYPDDEIIILDPAQEFGPTTVACGGRHVRLSPDSGNFLNPMGIADVTHQSEQLQIASKTEALIALCGASMADGDERQTDAERSIVSRCFKQALAKAQEKGREMLIGDVHEELRHQPDPEARFIALRLERYVDGALSIFNHPSNVEFDNPMMCFSFRDLPDSMRAFGMVAALEFIRNRMYRNFDRGVTTWLYVDEVQGLFGHPATISYLSRLWAEGRKFGLIATGITQNATYLLDNPQGRTLILNSDFLMLFKQSLTDGEKWRELLNLSEQELGYIDDSVKPGEGLLIAGAARVPIVDDWPHGRLYDLWNTKADEIAALKRAGASDGS